MSDDAKQAALDAVAVGDEVILWPAPPAYWSAPKDLRPAIAIVERATKTQLTVEGRRFTRQRGLEVGYAAFPYRDGDVIRPATEENIAAMRAERARLTENMNRERLLREIGPLTQLSVDKLERILAIVREASGE